MRTNLEKIRKRIYEILEVASGDDRVSRVFDLSIVTLIVLNVVAVILESEKEIFDTYSKFFYYFELLSVTIFTLELVLRLWSCTSVPEFNGSIRGRIRFLLTPLAVIDLLAILPFYLSSIAIDLRIIRVIRVFRIFRLFKMVRYSKAIKTLADVFRVKKEELTISLFALVILLLLCSGLMYYAEHESQPEKFSSIAASMWWGVETLTTVGYGDMLPVTPVGKTLGAIISILGIALFALPTGILASGFSDKLKNPDKETYNFCPHCGKKIDQK